MAQPLRLSETMPIETRKEVMISGEKAWLVLKDDILSAIEWENGNKALIVGDNVDFDLASQVDSKKNNLFDICKEKLEELEETGYRPIFTVERKYKAELMRRGLEPRATWIPNANLLAGTIGVPYYNKEGNRFVCVVKPGVDLNKKRILPRLTGQKGARKGFFMGVVSTEREIYPHEIVVIDTETMEVVDRSPDSLEQITATTDTARHQIEGQIGHL